ncbi:MAG: PQQ-binding-like beta-propeller repeat protein, partial [Saprospiraceae bacterium]|nr:PQQ-binding-like beta-propeller repeat protein [Saprospiraceae bacterium]
MAEYGMDDLSNFVENIVALDRETGAELWRHRSYISTLNQRRSLPVAVHGGVTYISWWEDFIFNGFLTAVDARTGAVLWEVTPDNSGSTVAEALMVVDNVLVALHFTHIVGYDLASGAELWEFDVGAATGWVAAVEDILAVDGKVAFTNTRIVGALDAADGSELWSHLIDVVICDPYADSAMASDGDDLFVMGMCRDQLRRYDLDSGVELWSETVGQIAGYIALANNVVYVNALDQDENVEFISAHQAVDGQLLQRLDVTEFVDPGSNLFERIEDIAVANGRLMAVVPGTKTLADLDAGTLFFWESAPNAYLPLFNEDESPDTNPDASAEVSIVEIDASHIARIQVAAQIGSLPATLIIYDSNDQVYQEGSTQPDEFGNGFWTSELEYASTGYEYQVILNDGTELPRRQVLMPPDPAA